MNDNQVAEFFTLLKRGIDRQVAVESLGVPFQPVQERLTVGAGEALEGRETEDAEFYLKVKQTEAQWEIEWFENQVLEAARDAKDVTKAFEPLARRNSARYASPGTVKVVDAESGGKGPGPALIRAAQDQEVPQETEEDGGTE